MINLKKITTYLVCITASILFGACDKDDSSESKTEQLSAILSSTDWKLSSSVVVTTSGNITQNIPACRLDNLWEYKPSKEFALYPGANKCTPTEVTILGNWELINDGTQLKITVSGGSYTDDVVLLNETTLQLKYALGSAAYIDTYIPN